MTATPENISDLNKTADASANISRNKHTDEIEDLRKQMNMLKSSLDSQRIFTDKCLRHVMAERTRSNQQIINIEKYLILPFCALVFLLIKFFVGTSWLFFTATMVMVCIDMILDIKINNVHSADFSNQSLKSLRTRLAQQQRLRRKQMIFSIPLLVLWALWMLFEIAAGTADTINDSIFIFSIGIIPGLIIGLIVAYIIYRKMQKNDSCTISDIDSLDNFEQ